MIVTRLTLTNVRAIERAEFRFKPGVNLIVGVNGVGKSTVLDALGVSLSAVVKRANDLRYRVETFALDDIRIGSEALTVECTVHLGKGEYSFLIHKPRETNTPQLSGTGMPREQVHDTPARAGFVGDPPPRSSSDRPGGRPLGVLFSTNRAVPSDRLPGKGTTAGGVAVAFADALATRELRLAEFAAWMRVQDALRHEQPATGHVLAAFEDAVTRFLPGYTKLQLGGTDGRELWINRGNTGIPVRQLSDGERGTLALVLDITRRLTQANPDLVDPAAAAEAVILIDEIDLHLHPKWQRQIVNNLTATFPRCQFIATTHSPQVIGEVAHDRIQIISDGLVYSPKVSYGVDSSRVLEEVMDADSRTKEITELLSNISQTIGSEQFDHARQLLTVLVDRLGEDDPEVLRLRTLLDFVEGRE